MDCSTSAFVKRQKSPSDAQGEPLIDCGREISISSGRRAGGCARLLLRIALRPGDTGAQLPRQAFDLRFFENDLAVLGGDFHDLQTRPGEMAPWRSRGARMRGGF